LYAPIGNQQAPSSLPYGVQPGLYNPTQPLMYAGSGSTSNFVNSSQIQPGLYDPTMPLSYNNISNINANNNNNQNNDNNNVGYQPGVWDPSTPLRYNQ